MFAFHLPINNLSFGNVSFNLLKEVFKAVPNDVCAIFPIGNPDLSAFITEPDFVTWLQKCLNYSQENHLRSDPIIKLWHINGSLESLSAYQRLLTFHETSEITKTEYNILRNQDKVFVSSSYTADVFYKAGLRNVTFTPLGFDTTHFFRTNRKYYPDDRVSFLLAGKMELNRKHTFKTLKAWVKKYGNDMRYYLNCSIFNPFMKPEDQDRMLYQALEGKKYGNVNFLPFYPQNSTYNEVLNANDICLGMQGCEGWNLPLFHSIGLGKYAVVLDAHVHKDYCNSDNAVLISPNGTVPVYDNIFFKPGAPFGQGDVFSFDDDEFLSGCDVAIEKVRKNRLNEAGLKLQSEFTWGNTLNTLLEN